jgi:hypothetical protein
MTPEERAALELPELDRECRSCLGSREACTPEWLAWSDQANAAKRAWEAANPGGNWYVSTEGHAIRDEEPAQDRMDCPKCQGAGYQLTGAGRELLRFLQRHPPALTRT